MKRSKFLENWVFSANERDGAERHLLGLRGGWGEQDHGQGRESRNTHAISPL